MKVDKQDPEVIGKNISALANGAVLGGRPKAYMIWGVDDDFNIKGTKINPNKEKVGNENLSNWLRHNLSRNASFEFSSGTVGDAKIVVLTIERSELFPVSFKGQEYIRNGVTLNLC